MSMELEEIKNRIGQSIHVGIEECTGGTWTSIHYAGFIESVLGDEVLVISEQADGCESREFWHPDSSITFDLLESNAKFHNEFTGETVDTSLFSGCVAPEFCDLSEKTL